jgi:hypothetical protein
MHAVPGKRDAAAAGEQAHDLVGVRADQRSEELRLRVAGDAGVERPQPLACGTLEQTASASTLPRPQLSLGAAPSALPGSGARTCWRSRFRIWVNV